MKTISLFISTSGWFKRFFTIPIELNSNAIDKASLLQIKNLNHMKNSKKKISLKFKKKEIELEKKHQFVIELKYRGKKTATEFISIIFNFKKISNNFV